MKGAILSGGQIFSSLARLRDLLRWSARQRTGIRSQKAAKKQLENFNEGGQLNSAPGLGLKSS